MLISRSRLRSFSGALVLAVVASGCSNEGTTGRVEGGSGSFESALDNTARESVRMSIDTEFTHNGEKFHTKTTGVRVGNRSSITFDYGNFSSVEGLKMLLVTDGKRQYIRYNGMPKDSRVPEGWVELDVEGGATAVTGGVSLDQYLAAMKPTSAEVKDLGSKKVDGETVHQYSTVLDLFASDGVTTSNRGLNNLLDQAKKMLSKVPARIDVDDHERIVRIVTDLKSAAGPTHSVVTLSDFGGDFEVSVPTDATQMTLDEYAGLIFPEPNPDGDNAPQSTRRG